MLLLVGLGNPGARYVGNRHNIGFMAVEAIAKRHGIGPWRRRFPGRRLRGADRRRARAAAAARNLHERIRPRRRRGGAFLQARAGDITVFHDEIDLPPGKVRVKIGGGIAGHNGLRSITAHIGNDYRRVRIGVGHPGDKDLVQHYVLSDFAKSERGWVEALIDILADNAELLARGQDASFQNKVHLAMVAKGFEANGDAGEAPVRPAGPPQEKSAAETLGSCPAFSLEAAGAMHWARECG